MDYLNKYQTNDLCNFCAKFNKTCQGKLWDQEKVFVNKYCAEFQDRRYAEESPEYHLKKYTEYTAKQN